MSALLDLEGVTDERECRIRVEVKNTILGDSVFWEGDAREIHLIRNVPARETAALVAADGVSRVCGMWHVSLIANK